MKKLAILTTLSNFDNSYSLVTVIIHQARIFKKYSELDIEIWVLTNCTDDYPQDLADNVKKVVPVFEWINRKIDNSMVPVIQNVLQKGINEGIDCFICHDILLVETYMTYNEAIRRIAGINRHVKWFHWMHSGPHTRPAVLNDRYERLEHTLPYNSSLVYLNYTDLQKTANAYEGATTANSYVVYNPVVQLDPTDINDPIANQICEQTKFDSANVRCIYPFSTTRYTAKQVRYVLEILNIIKSRGYSVKFIACNCHANGQNEKDFVIKEITRFTNKPYILDKNDILFTSMYQVPIYEYSFPHEAIIDLFKLSNLFIFPTMSEVCPIVLQEAALTNNLIVANADFPALSEITGHNGALFFRFGSIQYSVCYGSKGTFEERQGYFNWCVDNIIPELDRGFYQTNAMYNVLHNFNYETIWNKQLKPMLGI